MPKTSAIPTLTALPARIRHLVIVLGDQLDEKSSALRDFDPTQDVVWMAEVAEESTHVWSSKRRRTRSTRATHRWQRQKDLFAKYWAGVNTFGAFTGRTCPTTWRATR